MREPCRMSRRSRPTYAAILRAEHASRTGELRYVQRLQAVMRGLHTASMRIVTPHLTYVAGARQDVTRWGMGVEDRLHGFIQQLEGHVGPAFDQMAKTAATANMETQTELLGFRPPSGGVPTVILTARAENIRLMEAAAEDYADQLVAVMDNPSAWDYTVEELYALLQERGDVSMSRAALIARDQLYKLNAAMSQSRQTAAGADSYWWSTCRDERVRRTHRANEGRVFSWYNPSPITGHPGHDPNCRCLAIPIVK